MRALGGFTFSSAVLATGVYFFSLIPYEWESVFWTNMSERRKRVLERGTKGVCICVFCVSEDQSREWSRVTGGGRA